jgi:TPR repeat protein
MAEHQTATEAVGPDHAAEALYELGLKYATGHAVPADLVSAHKWLNLAAMRGSKDAARLRLEIAADMSPGEIATAQRAARDWLTRH